MVYRPTPIDTSKIKLADDLLELRERLAENTHDVWASRRLAEGWTYGPTRDDMARETSGPCPVRRFAGFREAIRPGDGYGDAQGDHCPGLQNRKGVTDIEHKGKARA